MIKLKLQEYAFKLSQFIGRQKTFYLVKRDIAAGVLQIGIHTYGIPRIDSYKGSEGKVR